jgi:hypothetical protein
MERKIGSILIITLVILSSIQLFTIDRTNSRADPSEGFTTVDKYIDFDYMWNTSTYLASLAHTAYNNSELAKGRYFGSKGEKKAADNLYDNLTWVMDFGPDNVQKIYLQHVDGRPYFGYSELVEVKTCKMTINHPDFQTETHLTTSTIPPNDYAPIAAVRTIGQINNCSFNYSYNNIRVINEPDFNATYPLWQTGLNPYNLSFTPLNDATIILGKLTYISPGAPIPAHDLQTVFLLNETRGVDGQIENATNASGVILLQDEARSYTYNNASHYSFPITRIDLADQSESQNVTIIKNLLENGTSVIADSTIYQDHITLIHDLNSPACHPSNPCLVLFNFSRGFGIIEKTLALYLRNFFYRLIDTPVEGIIIRDEETQDCHNMYPQMISNPRFVANIFPCFALPGYSVNNTIGTFLWNHSNQQFDTITGYINQFHHKETPQHPGVDAYDIAAYLNITHSPNDNITILSSRYDSMLNECSGDSGTGTAIIMGIAQYMQQLNQTGIKPKTNVTFLLTTNEENGYYGAQYYNDTHTDDNITLWIGTDQMGFRSGSLHNVYKDITQRDIVDNITRMLEYTNKTGYQAIHNLTSDFDGYHQNYNLFKELGGGTEDVVFYDRPNCNTILIHKDDNWPFHHRRGLNITIGDVINDTYFDRSDVNMFYNITWATVRYFLYNPDCSLSNITYRAIDSPNDGDHLNDSIQANLTIHTCFPHDNVRIEADLHNNIAYIPNIFHQDYTINGTVLNTTITVPMPDSDSEGDYTITLQLLNSTGLINENVYGYHTSFIDDTNGPSPWYHLCHPLGYTKPGRQEKGISYNISGSIFTAHEDGRADNITACINRNYSSPGPYQCMLYRVNDSTLIGTTTETWHPLNMGEIVSTTGWAVFNFTGTKPLLTKDAQYLIACWGDSLPSQIRFDTNSIMGTGCYNHSTYGSPPTTISLSPESRYYSAYCSYTPDIQPPHIHSITNVPSTVGFGYDVTITANVTEEENQMNTVTVTISHTIGGTALNQTYNMTLTTGDTYQYVFNDTWFTGIYTYWITANDTESNTNTSQTYNFTVSAEANLNVATLKDAYHNKEDIDLTDPPEQDDNLTLIDSGQTWNTYYNATSGDNILETSTIPINYQNETGNWTPINQTITPLNTTDTAYTLGYRTGNDQGLYTTYFTPSLTDPWPIAFSYNQSTDPTNNTLRTKLIGLAYLDPQTDWTIHTLQTTQPTQGQTDNNTITYPDVFTGTNLTLTYGALGLKEDLTLTNTTRDLLTSQPPSLYGLNDTSSYLVTITRLDTQDLTLYHGTQPITTNTTITTNGIDLKDAQGAFKCAMPLGDAYQVTNDTNRHQLTYRVIYTSDGVYLLAGLPLTDLTTMTYPVDIDPTITLYSSSNDGYIYASNAAYLTAHNSATGTIDSTSSSISIGQRRASGTYTVYRGFLYFNTSQIPSNAIIDSAKVGLYKISDYSTTDFQITIQDGQPTYPHSPMQTGDYSMMHYLGNGGSLNTASFKAGYNDITMTSAGLGWINRTSWTKLCLRSSRDITPTSPTGDEYVTVTSNEFTGIGCQPRLVIAYRNHSKIKNTGSTDIEGYLQIQVQYHNTTGWHLENDAVNETTPRAISHGDQLALDAIFNGLVNTDDLTHGSGTYRVYAVFRDPDGAVLVDSNGNQLMATYEFTVTL